MGREGEYSLAETNTFIFPVSILTVSFWDSIIGIRIDGAAKEGLQLRSKEKHDYGCGTFFGLARSFDGPNIVEVLFQNFDIF